MASLNELLNNLKGDEFRKSHPFSDDIRTANELLHNSSAFDDEMADCMQDWCEKSQPCQFGRVAAQQRRIHFSFLTHQAVSQWSDQEIGEKIAEDKKLWKQRAAFAPDRATHSFMLVVASPVVALAAPDDNLEAFSNRLLELAGWSLGTHRSARRLNEISSDYLYLRNPDDKQLYGFQFNVDFFACTAHGRWWHDHRAPGGVAFTANSLGHMRAYREWFQAKTTATAEWALQLAMVTIDNAEPGKVPPKNPAAQPVADGRATWLLALNDGNPIVSHVACPLTKTSPRLKGKDWTKYEGYLHTDHAIRAEFFRDRIVPPTFDKPYLMDFTYIYAHDQADFAQFMQGRHFTDEEVYGEIGHPEEWSHRTWAGLPSRSDEDARLVAQQTFTYQSMTMNIRYLEGEQT
jgi:hypothetical protein